MTIYWDDASERSFDPVNGYDFEGYKIYRSTDAGFLETFTITDGRGRRVFNTALAQFDLEDSYSGYFPLLANGASFYLGNNSGIHHVFVDTTVENGQMYYYAVTAYDHGDATKNIFPAETPKSVLVDEAGNVTLDINTTYARPIAPAAGYVPAHIEPLTHVSGSASGLIFSEIVDGHDVLDGASYQVSFIDSSAVTIGYNVIRTYNGSNDTVIWHQRFYSENIDSYVSGNFAALSRYLEQKYNMASGSYDASRYFDLKIGPVVDGHRLYFFNPLTTSLFGEASKWTHTSVDTALLYNIAGANFPTMQLKGYELPSDYDVIFYDHVVDTSYHYSYLPQFGGPNLPSIPVNFKIYNRTRGEWIRFAFDEARTDTAGGFHGTAGHWDANNYAVFYERYNSTMDTITWALTLKKNEYSMGKSPVAGDTLSVRLYIPFTGGAAGDQYSYVTHAPTVNRGSADLSRVKVYPNPYVGASTQEPTNTYSSGRGERRITFTHLPSECTIRIYTVRGELVKTIEHRASIEDGSQAWDMRTKDGLNIAYGVYIYHVDSAFGTKVDRFAIIK